MEGHDREALWTRPFIVLSLGNWMLSIGGALFLHLPGFLAKLGAREGEIGRVLALHALTAALLGPVAGTLMDRRGRRLAIRIGACIGLIATASYLAIDAIDLRLYALRVLDGVGATFLYASLFTYASELVPVARRTEGIALFGASGMVSMGISSVLGDRILAVADYRALFLTATSFCALGTVLCFTLPEVARVPSAATGVGLRAGVLRTLLQPNLRPIWVAALAFFSCLASLAAFMKTFVLETGAGSLGVFFAVYSGVALFARVFFGALPERVGLRRMVLPALGSYALGSIVLGCTRGPSGLICAAALCGIGHGYCFPVLLSLLTARARPEGRGTATSIYTAFDWTGNLLAPPLLGALIERAGYAVGFVGMGVLALLGVLTFLGLDAAASADERA